MPEVMEFYRMAGDVDYMLRVVVPDIAGYDAFYKRLIAAVPLDQRHVALRDGKDQVDDVFANSVRRRARRELIRINGNRAVGGLNVPSECASGAGLVVAETISPIVLSKNSGMSPSVIRREQSGVQL